VTVVARHPIRERVLRDYACECTDDRCRERVYLNVGTWKRAAKLGRVVCLEHVDGGVVERTRTYAIVEAAE
jgi:hypothetical protein